jgi:hypothetical protein
VADGAGPRLSWAPAALGAGWIAALLGRTWALRVPHPYDLEWMEGGMLLHGLRVMQGLPLYVQPSGDFIPFIYPPLYAWLLGLLGQVVGLGYPLGRSLSALGTLAAAGALAAALRLEGAPRLLAVAGAALYLSGYDETGAFYDLVRIDGLFMGLLGWALVAGRAGRWRAAGLALTLAFAARHTAAVFGLPLILHAWRAGGLPAARRFGAWSVLPAVAFTGLMQLEGDGLFLTYLLGVPGAHPLVAERLAKTPWELILALPACAALLGATAALRARPGPGSRYWLEVGALALLISAFSRAHHGGYVNVLMPGLWALAMGGSLGALALARRWPGLTVPVALALGAQLLAGGWDPARYAPGPTDRAEGDRLVARLAAIDGEVLAPWSPWLPVQAGKQPGFHLIALWDISDHDGPLKAASAAVDAELEAGRWAAVLTSTDKLGHGLKRGYTTGPRVAPKGQAMKPRTGWNVRPQQLWLRRGADDGGASAP